MLAQRRAYRVEERANLSAARETVDEAAERSLVVAVRRTFQILRGMRPERIEDARNALQYMRDAPVGEPRGYEPHGLAVDGIFVIV